MPDFQDRRAISGTVSPDVDILLLRDYNDDKCLEIFCETLHECCICFSEYAGSKFVRLPCKHLFCWQCMETYSKIHVKEGTVNKLLCPDSKCGGLVPPNYLKKLLGKEEFERWESLLLQKTLDLMADVVYCPRCGTACLEDAGHHAQCPNCLFSFCSRCKEPRHVGLACKILQKQKGPSQHGYGRRRMKQELMNEILSIKKIFQDAKQCPSCKTAITRNGGCNNMSCRNCGQGFCYQCGNTLDSRHSRVNCAPSANSIQEWAEGVNDDQQLGLIHKCPICLQINAKVGG